MKAALMSLLARVPARRLNLGMFGVLAIAGALVWQLGLRAPLSALRVMQAERARLQGAASDPNGLKLQNERTAAQVAALARALGQGDAQRAPTRMLVHLIREVDRVATRHGVQLSGATPGPARKVMLFEELPFDVEARGGYQALVEWMADIERSLPTLSIVRFEMHPADAPPQLSMKIRIAAYLLPEPQP